MPRPFWSSSDRCTRAKFNASWPSSCRTRSAKLSSSFRLHVACLVLIYSFESSSSMSRRVTRSSAAVATGGADKKSTTSAVAPTTQLQSIDAANAAAAPVTSGRPSRRVSVMDSWFARRWVMRVRVHGRRVKQHHVSHPPLVAISAFALVRGMLLASMRPGYWWPTRYDATTLRIQVRIEGYIIRC
jgi:hypothetical protein